MGDSTSVQDLERAEAVASAPPLPEGFEFHDAAERPLEMAEVLQDALGDQQSDIPLIDPPTDDQVNLPGGLVINGEVFRQVTVRELNGEDEEHLARAMVAGDQGRFNQVLLERGVVSIGPHQANEELLDQLLLGDRDMAILGIRKATYGDTMDLSLACAHCGVDSKIRVTFDDDVPIRKLEWQPDDPDHEVALRDGVAVIRLATGAVQRHIFGLENKTIAELNTVLLSKCVQSINGEAVNGSLDAIKRLGMSDRRTLVEWLIEKQPGPDYGAVTNTCTVCGKETPLNLSAADLFPGF